MSSNQKVQVVITGNADGLMSALNTAGKGVENMAHGMESAMGNLAGLAEKFLAPLTAMVGVLGGGALFKEVMGETAEFGDGLAKATQKVGMSSEALSGLAHAAKLADVSFEDLVGGMAKLSKNMQLAAFTPSSPAAAAFKALGIQVEDSTGHLRSSEDVMLDVAEKFAGMRDGAGKTALAMNIFGRGAAVLIPLLNEGRDGIAELTAEAKRLGVTMTGEQAKAAEKYKDDLERVDQMFLGLKLRIGQEVMPTLTKLAEWFTDKAPAMLEGVTKAMRDVGEVLNNGGVQITALAVAIDFTLIPALFKAVEGFQALLNIMVLSKLAGVSTLSSLGTALAGMISPALIAAAAIAAVVVVFSRWITSYSADAAEKAEADQRMRESAIQTGTEFHALGEQVKSLDLKVQQAVPGTQAHKEALNNVNRVVAKMVSDYPEFLSYLHKENGEYVGLNGSLERFTKNKLRLLEMDLEEEKRQANDSKNEAFEARDSKWSLFLPTKLLWMNGIADNADRERKAHEASAKAIQQQIDGLKGLKAEDGKIAPPSIHPDQKVKATKDNSEAEYERWLAKEKQMEAQHQADMVAIMDEGIDKQVVQITAKYDKMIEREKAYGTNEATLKSIELKRDQEIEQAKTDWAKKQADERKKIAEQEAKEARALLEATGTAQQGFFDGIEKFTSRQGTIFQQFSRAAEQMMQGVENAFAQGFKGILTGQMSLSQGLKSIWQGIMSSIVGMLAQIAAKWLVAAIAAKIFKDTTSDAAKEAAVSQQESAAATLWATYSGIPFVGPAIAAGFIALMNASLVANAAGAKGIVGAAEGGWFDTPTLTMIGEGKRPELVVPDVAFRDFAANLSTNILAQERQAQAYGRQASGYASAASAPGAGGGMGNPPVIQVHLNGPIMDTSQRGLRALGELIIPAIQAVGRQNNVVLVPGQVFAGGM